VSEEKNNPNGNKHDYKNTINLPETAFSMKADLANREPRMLTDWYKKDANGRDLYARLQEHTAHRKDTFILHDGPPYANGAIHIGHAVNKILKDIVVKSKLLSGYRSPYVPGWDCHGLPIEIAVEKKIGKVGQKVDARAFRKACREFAAEQIDLQREDFKRLGVLGDWDQPYRTMDLKFEADTIRALAKIVENGKVISGYIPVPWCLDCGSALAEAEIEYAEVTSPAIDVAFDAIYPKKFAERFKVMGQIGDNDIVSIPIWTTTPWTLPANLAVSLGTFINYVLVEGPPRVSEKSGEQRVLLVLAEALAETVLARYGVTKVIKHGTSISGAILSSDSLHHPEQFSLGHPFYEKHVWIVDGHHVTEESGTGAVHTAPAHGREDFNVAQDHWKLTALIANKEKEMRLVGPTGIFSSETEMFAGQHIWKANDEIIAVLRERGKLLAHDPKFLHEYPHCWRHKTKIIQRAAPQWFISMSAKFKEIMRRENVTTPLPALREKALDVIKDVQWVPEWGEERITKMIQNRPDWCISRQRTWGVPIALFVDKSTGLPHPDSTKLMENIAVAIEKEGVDVWYDNNRQWLSDQETEKYEKVTDILDVWFDSGVTHACVLDAREELHRPADLYLEGSDQHRGWFQSSLLTSVAMHGNAPYKQVLTHGFVVDAQGRKMSKSLGNVVAPQALMKTLGADVLRLWVAATDYRNEMSVSDEILKRVSDSYRRIRNTARFLLGNLAGFDPVNSEHLLPISECLLLDRWAISQAYKVQEEVKKAYENYQFHEVYQRVHNFCSVEMGALYLDITKDRLYTMQTNSRGRRSAQTAMYHILQAMVRWIAPILSFTAEEIWQHIPCKNTESILFEIWYKDEEKEFKNIDVKNEEYWNQLIALRSATAKVLEGMRNAGNLGASLEADVTLYLEEKLLNQFANETTELRFFFITSSLKLGSLEQKPANAVRTEIENTEIWISAQKSEHKKCIRCWHYRDDVGEHIDHPEICGRCVENVDGVGEQRLYF